MHADHPGLVRLQDPDHALTATFAPGAGMIGVSLQHRGEELLGQRRGLQAYLDAGKTMGIPFLHPWANRLGAQAFSVAGVQVAIPGDAAQVRTDPNGLPIHGLLAASPAWRVEPPVAEQGDVRPQLVASLLFGEDQPGLLGLFPFPHEIELAVALAGGRLTVRTTIVPTSDRPVPLAFGFHPYLTLPGVEREAWGVELPPMRHRPVGADGLPVGATEDVPGRAFTLGEETFDDGYDRLEDGAQFALSGGGRRIVVRLHAGYPAAQLFAPAEDPVFCVEPMAAPTNALVTGDGLRFAEPGAPRTASFSIEVLDTAS